LESGTSIRVKVSEGTCLKMSDLANKSGIVTEGYAADFLNQQHKYKEKTGFFHNSLCLGLVVNVCLCSHQTEQIL